MTHTTTQQPLRMMKRQGSFFQKSFDIIFCVALLTLMIMGLAFALPYITVFPVALILLFINGLLSIYGLLASIHRKASIHFVSFLFCFLFLSLAPIMQIGANIEPVFYVDGLLVQACLMSFFFVLAGVIFIHMIPSITPDPDDESMKIQEGRYTLLFFVTLLLGLLCIALFKDGLFSSREGFGNAVGRVFRDQALALIAINLFKLSPFFGAAIGFRSAWMNKNTKWIIAFGFLMLLAAIINNPMSSPRFYLAGLGFFFVDYMMRGQNVRLLAVLLVSGILAAPLFHIFRHESPLPVAVEHDKSILEETLISMDYDAFQIANYTILTVQDNGMSWGNNLLGAVLFFAPRKIWPGKPEPTPFIIYEKVIEYRMVGTNNLSTPLMAEGFYAFSWVGAIGISILFWYGITVLTRKSYNDPNGWAFLVRCVMVGLTLILLRGSLTVGMSAVVGFAFAAFVPWSIFYLTFQKKSAEKHAALV